MSYLKSIFFVAIVLFFLIGGGVNDASAQTAAIPTAVQTACNNAQIGDSPTIGLPAATAVSGTYSCDNGGGTGGSTLYFDQNGNPTTLNGVSKQNILGSFDAQGKVLPGSCSLINFSFQNCVWVPLMSWLGSWFLTVDGFLVYITGALFDILVQHVIIGFGTTISGAILAGIKTGWTVFRDVANIAIIGMFVFIAISTILGIQQYGARKLAARVIIVAVLLNFSLLFTEMIIDFSNFTAYQFYAASANTVNQATQTTNSSGQVVNNGFDIANAFLAPMGITSIWNTYCITSAAGGQPCSNPTDPQSASAASGDTSGWRAFIYGAAGGAMLAGVALVLAYGCWQIAARAITLIFLMITASIAFASYLLPKFADSEYGWKGWWGSLFNATVFAPLLMLFLFISLTILNGTKSALTALSIGTVSSNGQPVGLNTFISDPQSALSNGSNAWYSIFIYILVVGLLYASIKISSKVSSSLGSGLLSGVANIVGAVATGGVGIIAGRVAAPLARRYVGKAASDYQKESTSRAKIDTTLAGKAEKYYDKYKDTNPQRAVAAQRIQERRTDNAARLVSRAKIAGKIADSKMNVMDTKPAQALVKRFGVKKIFASASTASTQSYAAAVKKRGEQAAKVAETGRPDLEEVRRQGEQAYKQREEKARQQREGAAQDARKQADQAKQLADDQKKFVEDATKKRAEAGKKRDDARTTREDALIEATKTLARGNPADPATNVAKDKYEKDHEEIGKTQQREQSADAWKQEVFREALKQALTSVNDANVRTNLETRVGAAGSSNDLRNLQQQIVQAINDPKARGEANDKLSGVDTGLTGAKTANEIKTVQEAVVQSIPDSQTRATVKTQLDQSTGARESEMRHEEARINSARERILATAEKDDSAKNQADVQKASSELVNAEAYLRNTQQAFNAENNRATEAGRRASELDDTAKAAEKTLTDFEKKINEDAKKAADEMVARIDASIMPAVARGADKRQRGWLKQAFDIETGFDEDTQAAAESSLKRRKDSKRVLDMMNALRDAERAEGGSTSAPGGTT